MLRIAGRPSVELTLGAEREELTAARRRAAAAASSSSDRRADKSRELVRGERDKLFFWLHGRKVLFCRPEGVCSSVSRVDGALG